MRLLLRKFATALGASWRAGLLVLAVAVVWIAHYDRWTIADWQLPTDYAGDAPETLAEMQVAAEGGMMPLRPKVADRLGAPFGARWNGYPTPDKPLLLAVGALSHAIGLFAAANVGLLFAPITAALAFYFAARWLRVRWEWAWCGAVLFAFSYQTFHRGLGHFSLTFSWTVPLGLLAVWLVARSRRLEWRSPGAVVCLGAAAALGLGNPYHLFFWLQLMSWALVAQWFEARRRPNLAIGIAAIAVAGVAFIASNIEVWLYVSEPEGAPLISRNYGGTEMYALKPMEMLLPPAFHRWDAFAFLAQRYLRWSVWRGEVFFPYLGLVGVIGLGWLVAATLRRIFARRALPGQALSIGWLVAYATVGGLTNLFALVTGFQMFRATNRVAVFIAAIVLTFFVVRMARLTARWPAWGRFGLAFGLAAFGVLDQLPRPASKAEREELAINVRGDQQLARDLEAALPRGAMVFQLPVLGFPEVVPPHRLADYDLFRPFLNTSTLRFSYGAAKFRARSRWQRDLENAPIATLVRRLEGYGFAALYINRKGYEDRAEKILNELKALGYDRRIHGPLGQQVVVLLKPFEHPMLPLGRALTFGQGWHPRPDDGVRWANGDAIFSYFNPHPRPIFADLQLTLVGAAPCQIALERKREVLAKADVDTTPVPLKLPRLELHPGVNVFALRASTPAVRFGTGRYSLRSFGLQSSSIRVRAGDDRVTRVYDSD